MKYPAQLTPAAHLASLAGALGLAGALWLARLVSAHDEARARWSALRARDAPSADLAYHLSRTAWQDAERASLLLGVGLLVGLVALRVHLGPRRPLRLSPSGLALTLLALLPFATLTLDTGASALLHGLTWVGPLGGLGLLLLPRSAARDR